MDSESLHLRRIRASLSRDLARAKHIGGYLQRLGEALQGLGAHEDEFALTEEEGHAAIVEVERVLVPGSLGQLLDAIIDAKREEARLMAVLERQELIREHIRRAVKGRDQLSFRATGGVAR